MFVMRKNTLLRYRTIRDLYLQHKTEDIPDTVILRKYIYPRYAISRSTLNKVLSTAIDAKLKQITDAEKDISNH